MKILPYIIIGLFIATIASAFTLDDFGATYLFPSGGGTGTTTNPGYGQMLVGTAGGVYQLQATSTLGIAAVTSWTDAGTYIYPNDNLYVSFPYFIATSTTATSTITYALGVGTTTDINSALTVQGSGGNIFEAKHATGTTRMVIQDNGNVGIGTTAPGAKLDVEVTDASDIFEMTRSGTGSSVAMSLAGGIWTNVASQGAFVLSDVSTASTNKINRIGVSHYTAGEEPFYSSFSQSTVSSNSLIIGGGTASGNAATTIRFNTAADNTTVTGTERMVIDNTGNVGIGTTGPANKLHIVGVTGAADIARIDGDAATFARVLINAATGGADAQLSFMEAGGTKWSIGNDATDDSFQIHNAVGAFDGTSQFVIKSDGNVGIGTTAPGELLTLAGGNILLDNAKIIKWKTTAGVAKDVLRAQGDDIFAIRGLGSGIEFENGVGSSLVTIQDDGNVGIGTTGPNALLHVDGTSKFEGIINTNGNWISGDGGSEGISVDSTGRVGIGTTAPLSVLNVAGTTGITWNGGAAGNTYGLVTIGTPATTDNPNGGSLFVHTPSYSVSPAYQSGFGVDGSYSQDNLSSTVNIKAYGVKYAGYGSALTFSTTKDTSVNEAMRIDKDGNVGIGTTSPYAKLSVVGQTVAEYFTATSTISSTFPTFSSTNGTITYASSTALTISGGLFDPGNSAGSLGNLLSSTGSATDWIATSTLNITMSDLNGFLDLTSQVTGTLPVANGGTGDTDLDDILGTANEITVTNGANTIIGGNATLSLPTNVTITNASTTAFSSGYASSTLGYFGSLYLTNLATPAGTVLAVDASGLVIATTSPSGGAGTPGGSDTQIQYNDGSAFGGTTNLIYDDGNDRIGMATATPNSILTVNGTTTLESLIGAPLLVRNLDDAVSNQVAQFHANNRGTAADNDQGYLSFFGDDDNGLSSEFGRITWEMDDVTSTTKDSTLRFWTQTNNVMDSGMVLAGDNLTVGSLAVSGGTTAWYSTISGGVGVATSQDLKGSGANTEAKLLMYGSDNSISVNYSSADLFLAGKISEAASGNHPIFAGVAIKPLTIDTGAATVSDTASLYIEGAATTTVVTGENYSLWVDDIGGSGSSLLDGTTHIPTLFSTTTSIGSLTLPDLAVAAGTFLAVDATGLVIATSTPSGGSGTVTSIATTYPVTGGTITETGTIALAFGTTTSNTWAGTQTFTNNIAGSVTGNAATVTGFTPASGSLTLAGADALTITTTGTTNSTLPLGTKTLVATDVATLSSLTSIGTIGVGTWEATDIGVAYGGTGVSTLGAGEILVGAGASAITSTTTANLKASLGLNLVENTALTTWAGSGNILTVGALDAGSISANFGNIDIGSSNFDADGTITSTGVVNFGSATLEIPQNKAATAIGMIDLDTTDMQLHIATSTNDGVAVIPTMIKLFGGGLSSTSPDFVSGGRTPTSVQRDGFVVREIHCLANGGTSVAIVFSNIGGTTDSESVTCDTNGAADTDITSNSIYAQGSFNSIEVGTVTGAVDYFTYSVFGHILPE